MAHPTKKTDETVVNPEVADVATEIGRIKLDTNRALQSVMTDVARVTRAVLAVFEAGPVSDAQRNAILQVRVLLGDADAPGCLHNAGDFRDAEDVLRCALCSEELEGTPENLQPASANETPSQND